MPKNKLLIAQIIIEGAKIIENRKPVCNLRVGALFENSTSPTATKSLGGYKRGSAIMTFDTKHEFATNCLALFLVLSINNSKGRCVFMAQMVDRRKNKKPLIANATCNTMATVQSCAGFTNETVPFLALIFLTRDRFPIIFGL